MSKDMIMTVCLLICFGCSLVSLASQIYLAYWERKLGQAKRELERRIRTGGTSRDL